MDKLLIEKLLLIVVTSTTSENKISKLNAAQALQGSFGETNTKRLSGLQLSLPAFLYHIFEVFS